MSTKIVSDIQKIDSPIGDVYAFLSDLSKVGAVMEVACEEAGHQVPEISEKMENMRMTVDTCTFKVRGLGDMGVKVVEREEPKLIKLEGDGQVPIEFQVWIQLLENGPYDTRIKITLEAELNMMMKMLLKGKLENGINQLAIGLSKIPYGHIR